MSEAATRAAPADAIRLSPEDNVATVLRAVTAGERLQVRCAGSVTEVQAAEAIPLCHKVSLDVIEAGGPVVKYGQKIGETLGLIPAGRHVHVHNMRSARGRALS